MQTVTTVGYGDIEITNKFYIIKVESYVKDTVVFKGTFKMYYTSEDEQNG